MHDLQACRSILFDVSCLTGFGDFNIQLVTIMGKDATFVRAEKTCIYIPAIVSFNCFCERTKANHLFLLQWKILRGCACRSAFVCCYGCKCVNCDAQLRDPEADWEHFQLPNNKNSKTPTFYPPGKVIHVVKTVSVPG